MNPIAAIHFLVGLVTIAVALPLIQKKIKMNRWYGVRIPAAFESDARWFEINAYGGRVLARAGALIAVVAVPEFFLAKPYWVAGALAEAAVMILTLGGALLNILRHSRVTKKS